MNTLPRRVVETKMADAKDETGASRTNKGYECHVCKRTMKNRAYLQYHIDNHLGIRYFNCKICRKAFVTGGDLRRHLIIHTGKKPFKCEVLGCGQAFVQVTNLKRHHLFAHTDERPFACDFCPMRFRQSVHLKQHRMTHTDEKPFECKYCPKAFRRKDHLRKHIEVRHSGVTPYYCRYCRVSFVSLEEQETHENGHMRPLEVRMKRVPSRRRKAKKSPKKMTDMTKLTLANCHVKLEKIDPSTIKSDLKNRSSKKPVKTSSSKSSELTEPITNGDDTALETASKEHVRKCTYGFLRRKSAIESLERIMNQTRLEQTPDEDFAATDMLTVALTVAKQTQTDAVEKREPLTVCCTTQTTISGDCRAITSDFDETSLTNLKSLEANVTELLRYETTNNSNVSNRDERLRIYRAILRALNEIVNLNVFNGKTDENCDEKSHANDFPADGVQLRPRAVGKGNKIARKSPTTKRKAIKRRASIKIKLRDVGKRATKIKPYDAELLADLAEIASGMAPISPVGESTTSKKKSRAIIAKTSGQTAQSSGQTAQSSGQTAQSSGQTAQSNNPTVKSLIPTVERRDLIPKSRESTAKSSGPNAKSNNPTSKPTIPGVERPDSLPKSRESPAKPSVLIGKSSDTMPKPLEASPKSRDPIADAITSPKTTRKVDVRDRLLTEKKSSDAIHDASPNVSDRFQNFRDVEVEVITRADTPRRVHFDKVVVEEIGAPALTPAVSPNADRPNKLIRLIPVGRNTHGKSTGQFVVVKSPSKTDEMAATARDLKPTIKYLTRPVNVQDPRSGDSPTKMNELIYVNVSTSLFKNRNQAEVNAASVLQSLKDVKLHELLKET